MRLATKTLNEIKEGHLGDGAGDTHLNPEEVGLLGTHPCHPSMDRSGSCGNAAKSLVHARHYNCSSRAAAAGRQAFPAVKADGAAACLVAPVATRDSHRHRHRRDAGRAGPATASRGTIDRYAWI